MAIIKDMEQRIRQTLDPDAGPGFRPTMPMPATTDTSASAMPIGSTGDRFTDLLMGFDGILSKQAAVIKESEKIAKDMAALTERTSKFLSTSPGDGAGGAGAAIAIIEGARDVAVEGAATPAQRDNRMVESPAASGSIPRTPSDGGYVEPARGGRGGGGGDEWAPAVPLPASWEQGQDFFKDRRGGFSLSKVRQGVADNLAHRLSDWNLGPDIVANEAGDYVWGAGATDEEGNAIGGQFFGSAGSAAVEAALRSRSVSTGIKSTLGRIGGGQSLSGAMQSGIGTVGKAAGVAGAVYFAGTKALDFAESQRAENAAFQQVLGGSNSEGFGERARRWGFGISNMGVMGDRESERLYQGALDVYGTGRGGGRDERRTLAQDVGVDLYKQAGLDPAEWIRYVSTAAQAGFNDLSTLGDAIVNVGKAAREAGVNAREGREAFEAIYKQSAWAGEAGAAYAGAIAGAEMDLGQTGAAQWDYSNISSERANAMTAAQMGMSVNEFHAAMAQGGAGAVLAAKEGSAKRMTSNLFTRSGIEAIETMMEGEGGSIMRQNKEDPQWRTLALWLMENNGLKMPVTAIASYMAALGMPVQEGDSPVEAVVFALQLMTIEGMFGSDDQNLQATDAAMTAQRSGVAEAGTPSSLGEGWTTDWEKPNAARDEMLLGMGFNPSDVRQVNAGLDYGGLATDEDIGVGEGETLHKFVPGFITKGDDRSKYATGYMEEIASGNLSRNYAIEALIHESNFDPNRKYRLEDGTEVDLGDLIMSSNASDVFRAKITQGEGEGRTVQEFLAGPGASQLQERSSVVEVRPTPLLERILEFLPDDAIEGDRFAGEASSGNTTPNRRPGG